MRPPRGADQATGEEVVDLGGGAHDHGAAAGCQRDGDAHVVVAPTVERGSYDLSRDLAGSGQIEDDDTLPIEVAVAHGAGG